MASSHSNLQITVWRYVGKDYVRLARLHSQLVPKALSVLHDVELEAVPGDNAQAMHKRKVVQYLSKHLGPRFVCPRCMSHAQREQYQGSTRRNAIHPVCERIDVD